MPLFKRFIVLPIFLFILFGCGKDIFQEKENTDWPMVHKNLARTGSYGKPAIPPLQLKWKFQADGPVCSSPAVVNGIVYVVSNDSCCYALDAQTGKLKWKVDIGAATWSGDVSPVIANGVVFVGRGYALKSDNGKIIWHQPKWNSEFSAFIEDTVIYYANSGGGWSKVDCKTGNELLFFSST